jgi:hypothetical protein
MFHILKYEDRLASWSNFRNTLENCDDPIKEVMEFYNNAPRVSINTDPWDNSIWPNPWELINENQYCDFCILLGICYSLQLTNRFTGSKFEIYIGTDTKKSKTVFLLCVDDIVIDVESNIVENKNNMLKNIHIEKCYVMEELN